MFQHNSKIRYAIRLGLVLAGAPLTSARAEYRCDVERVGVDARACAIAAQGPYELRRFIERTRTIYGLYYWDYVRPGWQARVAMDAPPTP
ncbi:MAG: hypothetical protein ACREYD_15660 [Casimicrobiaceae bacterium]